MSEPPASQGAPYGPARATQVRYLLVAAVVVGVLLLVLGIAAPLVLVPAVLVLVSSALALIRNAEPRESPARRAS